MSDPDRPDPTEDNWLKLDSDACAISLDARLYDPTCPDDPDSKANTAVRTDTRCLAPHGSRTRDRHCLCRPLPARRLQSLRGHEGETHCRRRSQRTGRHRSRLQEGQGILRPSTGNARGPRPRPARHHGKVRNRRQHPDAPQGADRPRPSATARPVGAAPRTNAPLR